MKAARLIRNFSLKIDRRTLLLARRMATGARGPSLAAELFFVLAGVAAVAARSSIPACRRTQSACVDSCGSRWRARNQCSLACASSPSFSRALAAAAKCSSSSACTSA